MTFKASLREIDNGFLVELNPKVGEYSETYAPTLERSITVEADKLWDLYALRVPS
jgi:hypothetical protein